MHIFSCQPANSGFYFTHYYTAPMILPQWGNSAYIGKYNSKILITYTKYLVCDYLFQNSDLRIKENIREIESPLSTITKIRGVIFDYKQDYHENSPDDRMEMFIEEGKDNIGVIAQELEKVVPKLVNYNKESELYEINYVGLIPILVEAIKEQQQQIETLEDEINKLKKKDKSGSTTGGDNESEAIENNSTILYQNTPNPFTESTRIGYYLSDNVNNATIYIYDMNGTQLKSINLHQKGNGYIIVNGSELQAGMYMYSLITDGKVIDTKRMILTD